MKIEGRRIVNVEKYVKHIKGNKKIIIGVGSAAQFEEILKKIGYKEPFSSSQTVLPDSLFGPISVFNAHGKYIKNKDQEMETVYRQATWMWKEWHGPYQRIERSKIVDVPYKRYPRTFIPPPSVELTLVAHEGSYFVVTAPIENISNNLQKLKHTINLFLEIFGQCQLFSEDFEKLVPTTTTRINWEVLPRGEMPWERVKDRIKPLIDHAPKGKQEVLYHRLEVINNLNPNFRAIGTAGFSGYIIHGFEGKNLYVLESLYYGNATYVFENDWEGLSKMTKAEILKDSLHKARIVHLKGWESKLLKVLK